MAGVFFSCHRIISYDRIYVEQKESIGVCACVFSSHSFWTSNSLDVPAGVTQEEGHTGFLIPFFLQVRAFIFLARRIQPWTDSIICQSTLLIARNCPSDRFCRVQNLPTSSVELIWPITELYFRQILSTDFMNRFYLDVTSELPGRHIIRWDTKVVIIYHNSAIAPNSLEHKERYDIIT